MPTKFENRLIQKVRITAGKAIHEYGLIDEGDKILVGVSGGKDSLVLLEILAERRKFTETDYDLIAVHIEAEGVDYKVDKDSLQKYCDTFEVPLLYETVQVELRGHQKKTPCFICSWNRRKALFRLADELNCNKLALGHHLDDNVETLLGNMMYHATISALPPKLKMFDGKINLIRPLILCRNKDLAEFGRIRNFPAQIKSCKYENDTKRNEMKELLDTMEKLNGHVRTNIAKAMSHIDSEYLPPF